MIGVNNAAIDTLIDFLCYGNENFECIEQGSVQQYLGVKIVRSKNGKSFEMKQLYLIKKIVKMIGINPNFKGRDNPV
eukprot:7848934-Ditylum_brightwellii.AAC.1